MVFLTKRDGSPCTEKWLSSKKSTFLQSSAVQPTYFFRPVISLFHYNSRLIAAILKSNLSSTFIKHFRTVKSWITTTLAYVKCYWSLSGFSKVQLTLPYKKSSIFCCSFSFFSTFPFPVLLYCPSLFFSFCFKVLLTVSKLTPHSLATSFWVTDVYSFKATVLVRFFGKLSISKNKK